MIAPSISSKRAVSRKIPAIRLFSMPAIIIPSLRLFLLCASALSLCFPSFLPSFLLSFLPSFLLSFLLSFFPSFFLTSLPSVLPSLFLSPPKKQPAEALASAGTITHSTSLRPPYLHWPPVALSGPLQFQIRPDPLPAVTGSPPR